MKKHFVFGILILTTIFIGISARTMRLWGDSLIVKYRAERVTFENVKNQLKLSALKDAKHDDELPPDKVLNRLTQEMIRREKDRFDLAVKEIENQIMSDRETRDRSKPYLLEADPYYYYYLTKRIVETGRLSDKVKPGFFFNPMRQVPKGSWDWFTLHPYLGAAWFHLIHFINPKMDLMRALCWFPMVFVVIGVIQICFLGRTLKFGLFSIWLSSLSFVLSTIFLERSAYGWYDTDGYVYLVILLSLSLFCVNDRSFKQRLILGAFAGAAVGSLSLFWIGWQVVLVYIACAVLAGAFIQWLDSRKKIPSHLFFFASFLITSIALGAILLNPSAFQVLVGRNVSEAMTIGSRNISDDLWPNLFLFVSELNEASFQKILKMNGGWVSFSIACIGVVLIILRSIKRNFVFSLSNMIAILTLGVCGFVLTLRAQRFSNFIVIPMSLLFGFGVEAILNFLKEIQIKKIPIDIQKYRRFGLIAVTVMIALSFVVSAGSLAYTACVNDVRLIFNPVWEESLTHLKQNSPKDSVVFSFWAPGYFVQSVGERATLLDGGTPTAPENVWFSKAVMTNNERLSVGIFRMLQSSGSDALAFLVAKNYKIQDAFDMLTLILPLSREQANVFLNGKFSGEDKNALLNFTHSETAPKPAYVMIYSNMIEQNILLSTLANWDFNKAQSIHDLAKSSGVKLKDNDMFKLMSGDIWGYLPESQLIEKQGDDLYFVNGIKVNLTSGQGWTGNKTKRGDPEKLYSVISIENGKLVEKISPDYTTFASALLFEENSNLYAVGAHANLIQSVLYKLYYANGTGLSLFQPFYTKRSAISKTRVIFYRINWMPASPESI